MPTALTTIPYFIHDVIQFPVNTDRTRDSNDKRLKAALIRKPKDGGTGSRAAGSSIVAALQQATAADPGAGR